MTHRRCWPAQRLALLKRSAVKEGDKQVVRTVGFSFTRSANGDDGNGPASEKVEMNIPLLAMVKVPSLSIDLVDITFDMEVKSSETQSEIDE